jgi:hypothetical protein
VEIGRCSEEPLRKAPVAAKKNSTAAVNVPKKKSMDNNHCPESGGAGERDVCHIEGSYLADFVSASAMFMCVPF